MTSIGELAYACDNAECLEYKLIKLISLPGIGPKLAYVPVVICTECGYHALSVDLSTDGRVAR